MLRQRTRVAPSRKLANWNPVASDPHLSEAAPTVKYRDLPRGSWSVDASLTARQDQHSNPYLDSLQKRILDISVALLVIIILAPIFLSVAALVSGTSPGGVLFRQRRTGKNGKPFVILKFRSMYIDECKNPVVTQAARGDPRITPIGRFIRKTSIDELPQLINVLRGEMSLIGPRPHAVMHDELFLSSVPHYAERFRASPGISGLAQVNGSRGETPNALGVQSRVQFDLKYIETASLSLDLKILAMTAREMVFSKSAY
jgi:putative colanic acid biosysnthesis UDP-glucose lipid carrier transferase